MTHLTTTSRYLERIFRDVNETGYDMLDDYDKALCDAFDAGKLTVIYTHKDSIIEDKAEERYLETGKKPGE